MRERTKLGRSGAILVPQSHIVQLLRVHHSTDRSRIAAHHVGETLVLVPFCIFTVDFDQQLLLSLFEGLNLVKLAQGVLNLVQCFAIIAVLGTA